MKNYRVIVNGKEYEIAIEEIDTETAKNAVSEPAAPAKSAAAETAAAPAGNGETVNCPMQGTILAVNVQVGSRVKKGDVIAVLEAMKMENEIMAPCDGEVTYIIASGTSVKSGDALCEIK